MADDELSSFPKICPHCGGLVHVLPIPGGQGRMAICSQCRQDMGSPDNDGNAEPVIAREPPPDPGMRLRHLLASAPDGENTVPPVSPRAGQPGEAPPPTSQESAPKGQTPRADVRQDLEASLRNQGFVVEDDGQSIRLRAMTGGRKGPGLSASDIVRLAAELDGGVPPPEKRVHCPKCDAVIPLGQVKCQWCGATISPAG